MTKKYSPGVLSSFNKISSLQRLLVCLLLSIVFYVFIPARQMDGFTHLLSAWDVFVFLMVVISWITFFTTRTNEIRQLARVQDESSTVIFFIIVISAIASLLAVLLLLTSNKAGEANKVVHLLVAIPGMVFSWILVHTIFTLRYAHIYYDDHPENSSVHAGGLAFPAENRPDYFDFAYFSFVLGMTFQVSDVEITSRRLRRLALAHSVLSFGFNTIIVALTINIIAGTKM